MKRLTALFLSLIMLLGAVLPASAAWVVLDDLHEVEALGKLGLYDDVIDRAALGRSITRGEGTALLLRLIGSRHAVLGGNKHPFTDVPAGLHDAVAWAYTEGLTRGVSDTAFAPDAPMTRAMYLAMLFRALGYRDGVDFAWNESEQLCGWAGLQNEPDDGRFTLADALKLTWWAMRCVPVNQETTDGTWLRLIARTAGKITASQAAAVDCLSGYVLGLVATVTDPYGQKVAAALSLKQTGIGGAFTDPATERFALALTYDGEPLPLPAGTTGYTCRMPGLWSVYHCTYVPLTATLEALGFTLTYDARSNTLTGTTPDGKTVPRQSGSAELTALTGEAPAIRFCQPAMRIILDGKAVDLEHYRTLKADGTTLYEEALLMLAGGEYYIPLDLLAGTLGLGTDGGRHLFSERLTRFTYAGNSAIYRSAEGKYVLLYADRTVAFSGLPGAEVSYIDFADEGGVGVYDTLRLRLSDQAGRREDHVIDLSAMRHVSSVLYDYTELDSIPEAGITLSGVVAPFWKSSTLGCDAFALRVGTQTVWFRGNGLVSDDCAARLALADLDGDGGEEILIFLSTGMKADGACIAEQVMAFDRGTLTQLTVENIHGAMVMRTTVAETGDAWTLTLGGASCTIPKPSPGSAFDKPQRGMMSLADGVLTASAPIRETGGTLVLTYERAGDAIRVADIAYQPKN